MKNQKFIINKLLCLFASLIFIVSIESVNQACIIIFHQPKEPDALKKYKRF